MLSGSGCSPALLQVMMRGDARRAPCLCGGTPSPDHTHGPLCWVIFYDLRTSCSFFLKGDAIPLSERCFFSLLFCSLFRTTVKALGASP